MSNLFDAVSYLIRFLTPFIPSLASFALAWGLFEVTERRRAAMRRRAARSALVAELLRVEVILSTVVYLFSLGSEDPTNGVREFRWSITHSQARSPFVEEPPKELMALAAKSDEELAKAFRTYRPWRQPALAVPLPVLDSALANPLDSGLTLEQWQRLEHVKWESYLLEVAATDVRQWLHFTFTVIDPHNHDVVEENHRGSRMAYAKRANYMLGPVRGALQALGASEDHVAPALKDNRRETLRAIIRTVMRRPRKGQ